MSNLLFKRFFEVRLLHGYYLDHWHNNQSGQPGIFQEFGTNPAERRAQQEEVLLNKYNILPDITLAPLPETADLMRGLGMKWRVSPSGLVVGMEVNQSGSGATAQFFPRRMPPPDSVWRFQFMARNNHLVNLTNHALRTSVPAAYFFTNLHAVQDGKIYPSLSAQTPSFSTTRTWEMGELARISGALHLATETSNQALHFSPVADHQWVHTGDRLLLPKLFPYRFAAGTVPLNAFFELKDAATNATVKTINQVFNPAQPAPKTTPLDFRFLPPPPNPTDAQLLHPTPLPDGRYNLEVTINNVLVETQHMVLEERVRAAGNGLTGRIDIGIGATATDFSLLNPDNSLHLTMVPGSNPVRWQAPVFEIRFMARQSYWRYRTDHQTGLPTSNIPYTDVTYDGAGQYVVSKQPRRLTLAPTTLAIDPPSGSVNLPAPTHADLKYDQNQYFSELFLSTIKLT
jgi:hypothetical protein